MRQLPFLMMLSILVTSCGGGGEGNVGAGYGTTGYTQPEGTVNLNVSGKFVDAPVAGLTWSVVGGSSKGVTDSEGRFPCTRGQMISFEIGEQGKGLHIGNAPCGDSIFIQNLDTVAESNDVDDSAAKVGAILQSVAAPDALDATIPLQISNDFQLFDAGSRVLLSDVTFSADTPVLNVGSLSSFPVISQYVTKASAQTHISSSLSVNRDPAVNSLYSGFVNTELPNATNFNNAVAREKEFRITAKGTGACSQSEVDLNVGIYQATPSSPYEVYIYAPFERSEMVDANNTYCGKLGRSAGNDFDGRCFGFFVGKQIITGKDILIRSKIKDVDEYIAANTDFSGDWYKSIPEQFDLYGSLYIDEARLKGQFTAEKKDPNITDMPDKCVLTVNQRRDNLLQNNGKVSIPKSLHGSWKLAEVNPTVPFSGSSYCYESAIALMNGGQKPTSFDIDVQESGITVSNTSSISGSWNVDAMGIDDRSPGTLYMYTATTSQWSLSFHYNVTWNPSFGAYIYHKSDASTSIGCNLNFVKQ